MVKLTFPSSALMLLLGTPGFLSKLPGFNLAHEATTGLLGLVVDLFALIFWVVATALACIISARFVSGIISVARWLLKNAFGKPVRLVVYLAGGLIGGRVGNYFGHPFVGDYVGVALCLVCKAIFEVVREASSTKRIAAD